MGMSKEHLPLVSMLMFTQDSPSFADLSLKSVILQTYENIEILICDTSVSNETEKLVYEQFKPHFPSITYVRQDAGVSRIEQAQLLVNKAKGEYVNFLESGDFLYPERVGKLMTYFLADKDATIHAVISYGAKMSHHGIMMEGVDGRERLFLHDSTVDGKHIGASIISQSPAIIGGITSILFRRTAISRIGEFEGQLYPFCWGLATLFTALQAGKVVYVPRVFNYEQSKQKYGNESLQDALREMVITLKEMIEETNLLLSVIRQDTFRIGPIKTKEILLLKVSQIEQMMKADISIPTKERLMNLKMEMKEILQEITP
jgi:glycosyltransferase involved in cell wall biosynthesis